MEILSYVFQVLKAFLYEGVDPTIPGNGGKVCKNYIPINRRLWETSLIVIISLIEVNYSIKNTRKNYKKEEKVLPILKNYCSQSTIM